MKQNVPTAAVIIIGNEILSGRTADENIPYLAKRLNGLGIKLQHIHIIGDLIETIIETLHACLVEHTYVFTTGGIGPTHDDITAAAIAKAFNCPLELHPKAVEILEKYYGTENLNEIRLRMALIPKGADLIPNPVSLAPGFYLNNVFVMAGVPEIMRAMFDEIAILLNPGPKIYSENVHCLLGENALALELAAIQARYPGVEIGSYPSFKNRIFGLSLVLRGIEQHQVLQATAEVVALVKEKGGEPILNQHSVSLSKD